MAVEKQRQFDAINGNLAYYKVPRSLASRVRLYYDYLWACGHQASEEEMYAAACAIEPQGRVAAVHGAGCRYRCGEAPS